MEYNNYSKEQLIERIYELEAQLREATKGYIYIIQFENDKKEGVFKAGKTRGIENRFANYRSNYAKELGSLNVMRVGAVRDALAAEQYMHELIRSSGVQCINDEGRNKKSTTKSEWYIDRMMERIEDAFDKTMKEYGIEDDGMVKKYDPYTRDSLEEELIPITHYIGQGGVRQELMENMFFYHPPSKTVYKQTTYGKDPMKIRPSSGKFGMKKSDGKSCQVSLEYIDRVYGK